MKTKNISAYDRLAIIMAIEERIYRSCEPLREHGGEHVDFYPYERQKKEVLAELRKDDPNKLLDVSIRGYCDETSHSVVDRMVSKKFKKGLIADSESDAIYIDCSSAIKDKVLAFLRSSFGDELTVYVKPVKKSDHVIDGLSNWDDAIAWVKKRGLQQYVFIEGEIVTRISVAYENLIRKIAGKHEKEMNAVLGHRSQWEREALKPMQ